MLKSVTMSTQKMKFQAEQNIPFTCVKLVNWKCSDSKLNLQVNTGTFDNMSRKLNLLKIILQLVLIQYLLVLLVMILRRMNLILQMDFKFLGKIIGLLQNGLTPFLAVGKMHTQLALTCPEHVLYRAQKGIPFRGRGVKYVFTPPPL